MYITRVKLKNWRNFQSVDVKLGQRVFLVGANASGKSNFIDAIKFLHDITSPDIGGLRRALEVRGGVKKIRCLSARRGTDIEIEVELGDGEGKPKYVYSLGIKQQQSGARRTLITYEKVRKNGDLILNRPYEEEKKDTERLTQTYLEQISRNVVFREIAACFDSCVYLHLVPQLVRNAGYYSGDGVPGDPFGKNLLATIAKTPEKTRDARLRKIGKALKEIVPQMQEIEFVTDDVGLPHLEVRYEHWRGHGAKQRESEFSDGTLRLIGMFWSMLAGSSVLLLEEPEISLNAAIIAKLPYLFSQLLKKNSRQVIVSTHSGDMLSDESIGGEETLLLESGPEGTVVKLASDIDEIRTLLEAGLSVGDVVSSRIKPKKMKQLSLFDDR